MHVCPRDGVRGKAIRGNALNPTGCEPIALTLDASNDRYKSTKLAVTTGTKKVASRLTSGCADSR